MNFLKIKSNPSCKTYQLSTKIILKQPHRTIVNQKTEHTHLQGNTLYFVLDCNGESKKNKMMITPTSFMMIVISNTNKIKYTYNSSDDVESGQKWKTTNRNNERSRFATRYHYTVASSSSCATITVVYPIRWQSTRKRKYILFSSWCGDLPLRKTLWDIPSSFGV